MNRGSLVAVLAVASCLIMLTGTCGMLAVEVPPPTAEQMREPEPEPAYAFRHREGFYKALLTDDAKRFGAGPIDWRAFESPNLHFPEFRGAHKLEPGGDALETEHLRISLARVSEYVQSDDQGYRAPHLLLEIRNRTDKHLAYLVQTKLADMSKCGTAGVREQDAIALAPKQVAERTECVFSIGNALRVLRVEVMELTPLGHRYVSRLQPTQVGLDPRSSAGHKAPGDAPCPHVPAAAIGKTGELDRWVDVIDFYSRHNCEEYAFFTEYRRLTERLKQLVPAAAPKAAAK